MIRIRCGSIAPPASVFRSVIPNLPQTQTMGWCHLAGRLAILGEEYAADVAGVDAAAACVDHRPDDGPNHLVTEGVGADLEAQQTGAVVGRHLRPSRQHD